MHLRGVDKLFSAEIWRLRGTINSVNSLQHRSVSQAQTVLFPKKGDSIKC